MTRPRPISKPPATKSKPVVVALPKKKPAPKATDPANRIAATVAKSSTSLPLGSTAVAPQTISLAATGIVSTGSISGVITDAVTHSPLVGVCTYLYVAGGGYTGLGICTGGDGSYSLSGISPGTYSVAVYDPAGAHPTTWFGGATSQASAATVTVAGGSLITNINIAVSELTGISGRAQDAVTLGAVPGVCIYAASTGGGSPYGTCTTSADSSFAITGMASGAYDVAFYDPKGLHQTVHVSATVQSGAMSFNVDAAMPEVTAVVGTVADNGTGNALSNACVMLYTPAGSYVPGSYRCTDANGQFVIDGIASGTYALAYYDPSARFATQWYDGQASRSTAAAVVVQAGITSRVGTQRVQTFGGMSGIVRNADGTPAANVCVYADDLTGKYTGIGACSDANGRYTLSGFLAGQYKIAFYPPGTTGGSTFWYLGASTEAGATPIKVVGLNTVALTDELLTPPTDTTAPGVVTNVQVTTANSGVHLSWTNPSDSDFSGVVIRRAAGSTPPASPTDGSAVANILEPGNSFDDTHVSAGTTYSYSLFAHDAVPNYSIAVSPAATTVVSDGAIQHQCGTLTTSATWSPAAAPVYQLDCSVVIGPDTTLTLLPGTIIKARPGAALVVQGSLISSGTSARPIVLTSYRDDSAGGDTNGDGAGSGPAAGDWPGVSTQVQSNTAAPDLTLSNTQVLWASTGVSSSGASVSVTNGAFAHISGTAIDVVSSIGVPIIKNNSISSSSTAMSIGYSSLNLAQLDGNSGNGNRLNGVVLYVDTLGVSSSLPWSGNLIPVLQGGCNASLLVPPTATLTLNAGAVIKGGNASCSNLVVQGTLNAQGTAANPVTITSWRDDSVGGDTNADGSATGPSTSDWGGVSVAPAGNGNPDPNINLDHVRLLWSGYGLSASYAEIRVTNSTLSHSGSNGISINHADGIPTLTGNTISYAALSAITITESSLDLQALDGNSGSSNGLNGVGVTNDTVVVSGSLPWSGNLIPVITGGCYGLSVPAGVTLTLGAGTVIKSSYTNCSYLGIQGNLAATGTAANPVTFTSWRDDSVAGDTNGDGSATGPVVGDWGGLTASPAGNGNPDPVVALDHVRIAWASSPLSAYQSTVSVTNSSIDHSAGAGMSITNPDGIPTISGNTVTYASGPAISLSTASIDLGRLDGNSGDHNGLNGLQMTNDSVTVSSSLPWNGNLVPVLSAGCYGLNVPSGVTVTLGAGTIIKGQTNYCAYFTVHGTLVAAGTGAKPVVLTSWRDDSVGGDTNADGGQTSPAAGDWGGISASPSGNGLPDPSIQFDHVVIAYAASGLTTSQTPVTLTNSVIKRQSSDAVDINAAPTPPVLTNNTFSYVANAAFIGSTGLDLAKLNGNVGDHNGTNAIVMSTDRLSSDGALPWSGNLVPLLSSSCSSLLVPPNITLSLNPGTVIKGQASNCAYLQVQGRLVSSGTAANPVVLTSSRDDSAGGDTNGDGGATGPTVNDWGGVYVSPAGNGNPNPTIQLDHTMVRWASQGIGVNNSTVSVTNSSVDHVAGTGIQVSSLDSPPVITGNSVTNVGGNAIEIDNSGIDLNLLNANSGSNDGINGVVLNSDRVVASSALPWSGSLIPVVSSGCTSLQVNPNVTLTLGAGTVIKAVSNYCSYLSVQGNLVASGSAASPVVLTSWRDDTVGGDTNNDGNATGPTSSDWGGIYASPAGSGNPAPSVSVDHVSVRYATRGISANQGLLSVTRSSFSNLSGDPIQASGLDQPPTISDNTFTNNAGSEAVYLSSMNVGLDRLSGNSGSGNAVNGIVLASDTLSEDSTLPWSGSFVPVFANSFVVPPHRTLTLNAASILKAQPSGALQVQGTLDGEGAAATHGVITSIKDDTVGGDTNADGNATSPAMGDWQGVFAVDPGNGNPLPVVTLNNTEVRYATTGLGVTTEALVTGQAAVFRSDTTAISVTGDPVDFVNSLIDGSMKGIDVASGNDASFKGRITNTAIGAYAPVDAYLDATDVDWGDPSGPAPIGSGARVTGLGVQVLPFVGWTPQPDPVPASPGTAPSSAGDGTADRCRPVMFLGLRGSGQAPRDQWDDAAYSNWQDGFGDEVWKIENGFTHFLDQHGRTSGGRKSIALRYMAMHVPIYENLVAPAYSFGGVGAAFADSTFLWSTWQGTHRIKQYIDDEMAHCPDERFVLVGYSQGALSIHLFLTHEATPAEQARIAAVGLLADPGKNQNPDEHVFADGFSEVYMGDGVFNATGIYRKLHLTGSGPLPGGIVGRTISVCFQHDLVCSPGSRSFFNGVHSHYTDGETLTRMGSWLAEAALASGLPAEEVPPLP